MEQNAEGRITRVEIKKPSSSSSSSSSYAGYGKAAAPVRVTRGKDGVIYDPDQYDPNP